MKKYETSRNYVQKHIFGRFYAFLALKNYSVRYGTLLTHDSGRPTWMHVAEF